jgi:hypothetical protein
MPAPAALSGGTVTFGSVTLPTAGTATITADDGSSTPDTSPSITVDPGTITKLQVILPGETAVPGSPTGKTGTPDATAIGAAFTFTVNGVDANWNVVTSASNTISITSSDGSAVLPPDDDLVSGTQDFSVTLNTAGTQTITASSTELTNGVSANITVAAVVITAATGGSAISADDYGTGAWTSLTGPAYDEAASGNVGIGTFILNVPSGFEFDQGGTAPTVLMTRLSGGGGDTRNINSVASGTSMAITSISATQITFTVTNASNSGVTCSLTWQNVRVRPTAGTPLAAGNLTKTGTSSILGVTNGSTNFGTLTQVHGAFDDLIVTLPGETFVAGTGNTGTPEDQTANVQFNLTSVTAVDQYLNIITSDNSARAFTYNGPSSGPPAPSITPLDPSTVSFTNGVSTTTISATLYVVESNTTIGVQVGATPYSASSQFNVLPQQITWDGDGDGSNWNDANNWSLNAVPTTYHHVLLSGANTISLNATPTVYNITLSNAGLALTIPATYSLTVSNNYTQSNGSLNTETTFPSVSGTVSISGGTVAYTANGAQNISAQTYNNLSMSGSGTKTALGAITVAGDLVVNSGVALDDAGFQITGNGSNVFTLNSGASLILGGVGSGTSFPTNYTSVTLDPTSTVTYASNNSQTIQALDYGNLTSSGGGARTLASSGTIGIAAVFTTGGVVYTNTGSTIDFNGSGAQSIPDFLYYNNLATSSGGTKTVNGNITVEGNLSIGIGTTLTVTGTGLVQINNGDLELFGDINNSGTITIGL